MSHKPQPGIRYLVLFRREELQVIRRDLERMGGNYASWLSRKSVINRLKAEIEAIDNHQREWFEGAPDSFKKGQP